MLQYYAVVFLVTFQLTFGQQCAQVQQCINEQKKETLESRRGQVADRINDREQDTIQCFERNGCQFKDTETSTGSPFGGSGGPPQVDREKLKQCLKENLRDEIINVLRGCMETKRGVEKFDLSQILPQEEFDAVTERMHGAMNQKKKLVKSTCSSLGQCENSQPVIECLTDLRKTVEQEMRADCIEDMVSMRNDMCSTRDQCLQQASGSGCTADDINNVRVALCECQASNRDQIQTLFSNGITKCMDEAMPESAAVLVRSLFGGMQQCIVSQVQKSLSDNFNKGPFCSARSSPCSLPESEIADVAQETCSRLEAVKESVKQGVAGCLKENPFLGAIIGDRKINDQTELLSQCAESSSPFGSSNRGAFGDGVQPRFGDGSNRSRSGIGGLFAKLLGNRQGNGGK